MRRGTRRSRPGGLGEGWTRRARAALDAEPLIADLDRHIQPAIDAIDARDAGQTEALIREADKIITEALERLDADRDTDTETPRTPGETGDSVSPTPENGG